MFDKSLINSLYFLCLDSRGQNLNGPIMLLSIFSNELIFAGPLKKKFKQIELLGALVWDIEVCTTRLGAFGVPQMVYPGCWFWVLVPALGGLVSSCVGLGSVGICLCSKNH